MRTKFRKVLSLFGLGVALSVPLLSGAASPSFSCIEASLQAQLAAPLEEHYGQLKHSFQHHPHYSVEVAHPSEIKNQCALATCHLHAWASVLEDSYQARTGTPLRLSTPYWSARHWLEQSLAAVDQPEVSLKVDLTASVGASRQRILQFGAIPSDVWTAGDAFQSAPLSNRLTESVRNILARTKTALHTQPDPARQAKLRADAKTQISQIFENVLGPFPEHFSYEGKPYTPLEFAEERFPELRKPIVSMRPHLQRHDLREVATTESLITVQTSLEEIEKTATQLLDEGKSVYLTFESNASFVSPGGILSVAGHSFPTAGRPLPRSLRNSLQMTSGGHAVQLVGYDRDPKTGQVLKWKIRNSWGTSVGDQGYYHMYEDYFRTFVTSICFWKETPLE